MSNHILAIDQGTTSTRAILFDDTPSVVASAQQEFPQHYPTSGWVEHEPEDIWRTTLETVRAALAKSGIAPTAIAGIGLTNQRETVVVWDRTTGKAVHRAIVWQDRRTAALCDSLRRDGLEAGITAKTGLLLDSYFSATKIAWILDNVEGARAKAENGELLAGTIDTFLIWKLTGGRVHVTDATNASRTLLFDIRNGQWDDDLLDLFKLPRSLLPEVKDSPAEFGVTDAELFGAAIPIRGVAGDQQAAMLGQACFERGMMKATYGTGCFALLNTGKDMVLSQHRLLTTIAYQLKGQRTYALEGSIFVAGAAIQWLRDGLKVIDSAEASGKLASEADPNQSVYLVPAFVGLGAPHWDADARGAIFGITRNTGAAELAKAALESVAFQTTDLLQAMAGDWDGFEEGSIFRVDGGMVRSDWAMQRLADLTGSPVDRPVIMETTALGAAWLAGWQSGIWPDQADFAKRWRRDRCFEPDMPAPMRQKLLGGWKDAVRRTASKQ